jgi:soluble lytic murein transglycosylase-like protein|tara:strand:- start:22 stop:660 length:639 start_codon:yes stop_codon:yes gene_type:complete
MYSIIGSSMLKISSLTLLTYFVLSASNAVWAENKKKVYQYISSTGVPSFTDKRPTQPNYTVYKMDCYACKVDLFIDWRKTKLYENKYSQDIETAAYKYRVDPAYVRAIIHAESHFNPKAVSKQGAQGLMQLMPATANELGVKDSLVASQNINGGVKHLAKLLNKYNGNIRLVSAAYNAGEGAVKIYRGIPPYPETKVYVERVDILHQRYLKN